MFATLTWIALGLMGAGTAINARGQIQSGNAARAAGEAAAQQHEFNAKAAEQQATDALAVGHDQESRFRGQVRGLLGSQRAGYAAQNVDVGVGSPVDVQRDAAHLGELDALQIRSNAQRQAWGFRMEAQDRRLAANVARKGGQAAQTASRYGAAGSILGTGSSLLLARYGWDRSTTSNAPVPGVR